MDVCEKELAADDFVQKTVFLGVSTLQVADGVEEEVVATGAPNERLVISEELKEELQENSARLVDPRNGDCDQGREEDVRKS